MFAHKYIDGESSTASIRETTSLRFIRHGKRRARQPQEASVFRPLAPDMESNLGRVARDGGTARPNHGATSRGLVHHGELQAVLGAFGFIAVRH